jgi:hypothetical protein
MILEIGVKSPLVVASATADVPNTKKTELVSTKIRRYGATIAPRLSAAVLEVVTACRICCEIIGVNGVVIA